MESNYNAPQDGQAPENLLDPEFNKLEKEKHRRRFQLGTQWMGVGAGILVLSFALNYLLFQCQQDCTVPMYTLTSIGALVCLRGMMYIF